MSRGESSSRMPSGIFWILGIKSTILILAPIQDMTAEQLILPKLCAVVCAITSFVSIWLMSEQRREIKIVSLIPFASIALFLVTMALVDKNNVSLGLVALGIMVISVIGFVTRIKVNEFLEQVT